MNSHPESPSPQPQELHSVSDLETSRRQRKSAASIKVSTQLADEGYDIPPTQVESWLLRRYLHTLHSSLQHNLNRISEDQPAAYIAPADLQPVTTLADQFQLPVPAIEDLLSDPIEINSKHSLPLHTWLSLRATALSRHYHAYHQTAEPSSRAAIGDIQKEIRSRITSHLEAQELARKEANTLSPKEQILQSLHTAREGTSLAPLHDTFTEIWHRAVDPQASFLDQARSFAQLLPHHIDSVTQQRALLEAQDPHRTIQRRGKETLFFLSLGTTVQYFDKYSWYNFPDPAELTSEVFTETVDYMSRGHSSLTFRHALALHLPYRFTSIIANREGLTYQQVEHPDFPAVYRQIQEIRQHGWLDQAAEEPAIRTSLAEIGLDSDAVETYLRHKLAAAPTVYEQLNHEAIEDQELYQQVIALIDELPDNYQHVLRYKLLARKGEYVPESIAAKDLRVTTSRYRSLLRDSMAALRQVAREKFTADSPQ